MSWGSGIEEAKVVQAGTHKFNTEGLRWHVEGLWMRNSYGLMTADAKVGKTWFSLQLGLCIANGIPFLGFKTEQSPVLMFSPEGSRDEFHDRVNQLGNRLNIDPLLAPLSFVEEVEQIYLNEPKHQQFVVDCVKDTGARFLIFDPLSECHNGSYLQDNDAKPSLDFMSYICRQFNCSFMVLHHTAKAEVKSDHKSIKGAGVLFSKGSSYLFLKKQGARIRVSSTFKNSPSTESFFVNLEESNGSSMMVRASEETKSKDPTLLDRFLFALYESGTKMTTRDFTETVKGDRSKYKSITDELEKRGLVKRYKTGGIIITKEGKKEAEESALLCSYPLGRDPKQGAEQNAETPYKQTTSGDSEPESEKAENQPKLALSTASDSEPETPTQQPTEMVA